ncbi:MAG: dienelactone hydrolase family protein [Rhodospirillales bacterium]
MTRRAALTGMAALAGAAVLPLPARAQKPVQQKITLTLPGGKEVSAALFLPLSLPAPAIVVAPNRYGLIEPILDRIGSLAFDHYLTVAVDLYDGVVAADVTEAQALEGGLDRAQAFATVMAWTDWIRADARCNRNVGLMGFGLGGGLVLDAALIANVLATVIYDTPILRRPEQLAQLTSPLLGHYSDRDLLFSVGQQEDVQFELKKLNKRSRLYRYDAEVDFSNPLSPNYSRSEALLAWNRSVAFLRVTAGIGSPK